MKSTFNKLKFLKSALIVAGIALITLTTQGCSKNFDNDFTDGFRTEHRYYVHEQLSFEIDSIRDYRCPANMYCIWAGDVDLFFKIYYQRQRIDTMVHMYTHNENPFDIGGYRWKITEVSPYPGTWECGTTPTTSEKSRTTRVKMEIDRVI
jgi:hypothetical protein